jgi:hypothetical protein
MGAPPLMVGGAAHTLDLCNPQERGFPFEWAKLRCKSGAQPIFFLVALVLYTSPSPPNRDKSLMEIYMTITCHLTDYNLGTLPVS